MKVREIRRFFKERRFLEMETPILQTVPVGPPPNHSSTHHKALDLDLYLRIAPELYSNACWWGFNKVSN